MAADMEMVRQPTQVKLCCFAISKSTFYKTDWCDVQEYQEEQQPDESYPQEAEEAADPQVDFFRQGSCCPITVTFKSDKINVHPPGGEAKRESICSEPSQPIPLKSSPWLSSFGCFALLKQRKGLCRTFQWNRNPFHWLWPTFGCFAKSFPTFQSIFQIWSFSFTKVVNRLWISFVVLSQFFLAIAFSLTPLYIGNTF